MKKFEGVTIEQIANSYFEGNVSSRTVYLADGDRLTLGFMLAGEYQFGTNEKERMEIVNGQMEVLLPDETNWQLFSAGESFEIPSNASFQAKTTTFADYTCYYLA